MFKRFNELVLFLFSKKRFHNDIKPQNICLDFIAENNMEQFIFKLIDMESVNDNVVPSMVKIITPCYYEGPVFHKYLDCKEENETIKLVSELYGEELIFLGKGEERGDILSMIFIVMF